jgi:hypothetical protein
MAQPEVPTREPLFPHVVVKLTGSDGNAFAIMVAVKKAMKRASVDKSNIDAFLEEAQSGDYDHLLQTAMKTVTVK